MEKIVCVCLTLARNCDRRDPIADSIDINAEHLEPFYQLKMVSE